MTNSRGLHSFRNNFEYILDTGSGHYHNKLSKYYHFKSSTYPGISYLHKEGIKTGLDIWFRVEFDWGIYAGFVVAVNGEAGQQVLSEKEIGQYLPHIEPCIDNSWAYWESLPHDDETQVPNFKYPNDEDLYFKLFDEVYFK
ncbi:hypothetical protein [Psychrobacillus sp. FSL H8-0510]|uniref:hypothetical protein n=1 Tax=Psychrobacillus sp. FSL H8-0510 TaxID=2921394 RepID=UPI0030F5675E